MKRIKTIFTAVLLTAASYVAAQPNVEFTASAPSTVYVDTPFQLVFSVNASAKNLRAPDFQFFEILAGPFESRSSSWRSINGKTASSVVTISYTFTLMPSKTGTFKIPPASITVDDEEIYSNGLSIKVEAAGKAPSNQNRRLQGNQPITSDNAQKVTSESIFVRTIVSKSNIYEQEAILVTYKLYTLVDVAQFTDFRMPDYNGFLKQEIAQQPTNKQLSAEIYNGRNYGTVILYQTLLFPQRTGEIIIDKANFVALLRLRNEAQIKSIFDDFFDSYSNVERNMVAPGARIKVNELPINGKPSSFSGAVGDFKLTSSISSESLKTNEPVTLKIIISGSGNMKLLKNPEIKFPDSFEVYDPKVDNQFSTGSDGVSGTKTIEYLLIPRRSGKFEIPSIELSYFDLKQQNYKTLSTPIYLLNVLKGEGGETIVGNYTNKEDITELAKDIRYIYTGNIELKTEKRPMFGTMPFWIIFLLPLIISAILLVYLKKQLKDNADITLVKTRRANKIARKRLKLAQKYLNEGKKELFYEEAMKAVWAYLSDKLLIPVAELNKENVSSKMEEHHIDAELILQFSDILNTCEFASYAPNIGQQQMGDVYQEAVDAIIKIEQHFKTIGK